VGFPLGGGALASAMDPSPTQPAAPAAQAEGSAVGLVHPVHAVIPTSSPPTLNHPPGASHAHSAFVEIEADGGKNGTAKKNAWTAEEDEILTRVVGLEGAGHWTKVAAHLPGRMGRQCRERWFNHLAPEVKKGFWTQEEDSLILAAVREHGTRWSTIQKLLPGRSDNSIKNRYYSAARKAQRLEKRATVAQVYTASPEAEAVSTAVACVADPRTEVGGTAATMSPAFEHARIAASMAQANAAAIGINMRHSKSDGDDSPQISPQGSPPNKRKRLEKGDPASSGLMLGGIAPEGLTVVTAEACGPAEVDPAAASYQVRSVISLSPADATEHAKFRTMPTSGLDATSMASVNSPIADDSTFVEAYNLPAAHAEVSEAVAVPAISA